MKRLMEVDILANDLRGLCFHQLGAGELAEHLTKIGYTRHTRHPEPSPEQNKVDIKELFNQIETLFPELKASYWELKEWSEFTSEWDTITRIPPEPSPDRVEKGAILIEHAFRHWCDGSLESFKKLAREILSLFPEPVLTRISDHEIEILLQTSEHDYYNVTEGDKAIAQAQLAHNQKQIKGE